MSLFDNKQSHKNDFDLEVVLKHFKNCLETTDHVSLPEYLLAFHELCRFFKLTGPLFAFVAKDLEYKIKSIEHHIHSRRGEFYKTVFSMVEHETERGVVRSRWPRPSGTHTMLRLHWVLEFIREFLKRLMNEDDDARTSKLVWEIYSDTLALHHPWITRQLAKVAVFALPSKKKLIDVMCKQEMSRVVALVAEVVAAADPVYSRVEQILQDKGCLES